MQRETNGSWLQKGGLEGSNMFNPYGRKWRRTKEPLDENEGEEWKIQKTKIMASSPIILWQIDGETVETVSDFIFLSPKSQQMVIAAMKLKDAYFLEGKLWPT